VLTRHGLLARYGPDQGTNLKAGSLSAEDKQKVRCGPGVLLAGKCHVGGLSAQRYHGLHRP
jgi:hypothetical protein